MGEFLGASPTIRAMAEASYNLVNVLYKPSEPVNVRFQGLVELCRSSINPEWFREILGNVPDDRKYTFLYLASDFFFADDLRRRNKFMSLLMDPHIDETFCLVDGWYGERKDFLYKYLKEGLIRELARIVVEREDPKSRFLVALNLAVTPYRMLDDDVVRVLNIRPTGRRAQISVSHLWNNCSCSEEYMEENLKTGEVVLIDDCLLVKNRGYKTGLCVRTTAVSEGTFVEGSWYTPVDDNSSDRIDAALSEKKLAIATHNSTWAFIRDSSIYLSPGQRTVLLNKAKRWIIKNDLSPYISLNTRRP